MDNDSNDKENVESKNETAQRLPLNEDGEEEKGEGEENDAPSPEKTHLRRRAIKKPKIYFYIGGSNGAHLVEENLTALGWERITDRTREDFKLKWCEIKSHNNYHSFREGDQLCYQIPNNKLLTTKIGLLTTLQEYDRVMNKVKKGRPRIMRYQDFFPETYRLDVKDDRELFFEAYNDDEIWISKPTGMNQGKGIYLIRSREDIERLQEKILEIEEDVQMARKLPFKMPLARVVQRYVENPLLLDNRKFDVRNYLLIACANPLMVFYGDGYCRLTCMAYDHNSTDLTGHLTNQFMQKKNPLYEEVKEDTVWHMDRFNDYINEHFMKKKGLPEDWVHTVLKKRCQQIMLHCFQAVRHKLECRLGFFDLIGCDFIVDDDFKISLLEMNCNPALHMNCEALKEVIPDVVGETLKLTLEIFDKALKRERIMPLASQRHFVLLYNGDSIEAAERRERLQSAAEARRRAKSAQRRKRFVPGQFVYKRSVANPCTANTTTTVSTTTTATATSSHSPVSSSHNSVVVSTSSNIANTTSNIPIVSVPGTNTSPTSVNTSSVQPLRMLNLPSSTVTALTTSSQQRVTKSKSTPNVTLKPFYAGGTVASRPYSAPKFNRKYAQVESRLMSHNSLCNMESPRRDSINNAALTAASNSKLMQKAKSVLLTPSREEVSILDSKENDDNQLSIEEELMQTLSDEIEAIEREKLFEQILEEEDEIDTEDEEEMLGLGHSPSPEMIRRPSAKLPSSYHNSSVNGSLLLANGMPGFSRNPAQPMQNIHKKISRIASLSVRGNLDLPPPSVHAAHPSPRMSSYEQGSKMQYRTPTTVRIRQSLPATTCTLEIGPKSRRGLIAIPSTGKTVNQTPHEMYPSNRKLSNATRLKLINASQSHSEDHNEVVASSALIYLAATHVQNHSSVHSDHDVRHSYPVGGSLVHCANPVNHNNYASHHKPSPYASSKIKSDSSTQTNRHPRLSGEEKVIWRLRSRVNDTSPRNSDGAASPLSQNGSKNYKVPLRVPVVTQSPTLITPRKVIDPLSNRRPSVPLKKPIVSNSSTLPDSISPHQKGKVKSSSSDIKEMSNSFSEEEGGTLLGGDLASTSSTGLPVDKPTALSKVVAIATAVPTHYRPNENKQKSSNFNEEPTLLTAG